MNAALNHLSLSRLSGGSQQNVDGIDVGAQMGDVDGRDGDGEECAQHGGPSELAMRVRYFAS